MNLREAISGLEMRDNALFCHGTFTGLITNQVKYLDTPHPFVESWNRDSAVDDNTTYNLLTETIFNYWNVSIPGPPGFTYRTHLPVQVEQIILYENSDAIIKRQRGLRNLESEVQRRNS